MMSFYFTKTFSYNSYIFIVRIKVDKSKLKETFTNVSGDIQLK